MLATHLRLMPILRMSGTISLLPIYTFMRRQGKLPFRSKYSVLHFSPNLAKISFFLKECAVCRNNMYGFELYKIRAKDNG